MRNSLKCRGCWLVLLGLSACSTSSSDSGSAILVENAPPGFGVSPDGQGVIGTPSSSGGPGNDDVLDPEQEVESSFRAPVVTGRYVWSANPDSGRVAVIDAESFEVRSVEAGLRPTEVAALDSDETTARAIVLNRGSADATLLSMDTAGSFSTVTVPTHRGADQWSIQAQGNFAIAWTDFRNAASLDPTDGFQDITVIDIADPEAPIAVRLTVGYRPSAFYFNADGSQAFAVTEDGVSVVDLEPGRVRLSPLVALPSSTDLQPDVSVLPDGSLALARIAGESRVHVIDLEAAGAVTTLEMGGVLTDLDISSDGSMAVAVIRNGQQQVTVAGDAGVIADAGVPGEVADSGVAASTDAGVETSADRYSEAIFIPLPAGLTDSGLWQRVRSTREFFGSVVLSPNADQAVLYTTLGNGGRVTLLNATREARSVELFAGVQAVFITPDGSHAVVLQRPAANSVRQGAFSVVSLSDVRAPKRVASDAPTLAVALGANSERALVSVSNPGSGVFGAYLVRMPSLQVDFSALPSRPLSTGTVTSVGKAFVAQSHPEGRLTFFDFQSGESRDITGFELSAKVVNE